MPSETEKELKRQYAMGEISEGEYYSAMERLREVEPEPLRPAYAKEAGILDNYLKNMGNIDLYAAGKISHEEQTILSWKNGLKGENDSQMRSQVISLIRNMQNEIKTNQSLRFYDRSMPNHIRYQKLTEEDISRMENCGILDDPETGKRNAINAKTHDSEVSAQVDTPRRTKPFLSERSSDEVLHSSRKILDILHPPGPKGSFWVVGFFGGKDTQDPKTWRTLYVDNDEGETVPATILVDFRLLGEELSILGKRLNDVDKTLDDTCTWQDSVDENAEIIRHNFKDFAEAITNLRKDVNELREEIQRIGKALASNPPKT
jgi:hypothetical protein